MGHTAVPTKAANDDITATLWNTYVRDNDAYHFNGRPLVNTTYLGSAITGTTTSFAAVSTANARMNATINSGRAKGLFEFPFKLSFSGSGVAYAWFDVAVDGTRLGDSTLGLVIAPSEGEGSLKFVQVPFVATGLSVGSHNFDLYWKLKTVSGSGYQMNIQCTSAADGHGPLLKHLWEY